MNFIKYLHVFAQMYFILILIIFGIRKAFKRQHLANKHQRDTIENTEENAISNNNVGITFNSILNVLGFCLFHY